MKLTIFTCTYNEPALLVRAMDSVPRHPDIEYLVINDGSTDKTCDVLKTYQMTNPDLNMKVISYQDNQGLGHAKNVAYECATGDYLYQLDHDDYLYTNVFLKAMEELDGTDIVYVNLETNDGTILKLNPDSRYSLVAVTTKFIKREFIGETRTLEDRWDEDFYFFQELQRKTPTEKYTGLVVYHYNFPREGSMFWRATHNEL